MTTEKPQGTQHARSVQKTMGGMLQMVSLAGKVDTHIGTEQLALLRRQSLETVIALASSALGVLPAEVSVIARRCSAPVVRRSHEDHDEDLPDQRPVTSREHAQRSYQ